MVSVSNQSMPSAISQNHAVIVVEDLRTSNMSWSAKGTVEEPGRNVAGKSGLNKSIWDQGWRLFRTMLTYKQHWRGGMVIAVPPWLENRSAIKITPNGTLPRRQ